MQKILKKMNVLLDGKQKAKMGGIIVLITIWETPTGRSG